MRVTFWGTRGSIPTPGPDSTEFGGNTPCVQIACDDGSELILDAGSGIRALGRALVGSGRRIHILLTHLHLDHIQGLLFFAPFFDPRAEITVWGPPSRSQSLRGRLARYLSSPLSPVEIRDLPARVSFESVPGTRWRIDGVDVRAALVAHRGPTLGYRIEVDGASVCYLPDHEPGLGADLDRAPMEWVSGLPLARGASALIHDGQYREDEYSERLGWGHSALGDALAFAARAGCERTLLFHHDPGHDDDALEAMEADAEERWNGAGSVQLARERMQLALNGAA